MFITDLVHVTSLHPPFKSGSCYNYLKAEKSLN